MVISEENIKKVEEMLLMDRGIKISIISNEIRFHFDHFYENSGTRKYNALDSEIPHLSTKVVKVRNLPKKKL